jgi:acetate kinase
VADAILVLNAGSSSIKFSLFLEQGGELAPRLSGLLEGLYTAPRFTAKDASGASLGEKKWGEGARLGHDGAIAHLVEFLGAQRA